MTFCASPSADHVKRESDCETYRQLLHGSTLDRTLLILAFHSEVPLSTGAHCLLLFCRLGSCVTVEGLSRRMLRRGLLVPKLCAASCLIAWKSEFATRG